MLVYLVVFFAAFLGCVCQSAVGFGAMLVAMPLLTLVLPLQTAAPMMAVFAVPTTLYIFYQNRRGIDWREVFRIVAGAAVGVPIGLWALGNVDATWIMRAVGGVLIFYAIYVLFIEPRVISRGPVHESNLPLSLLTGLATGLLSGAFNTGGPPLILYGDWLRWPPERFKAILQGVFLVNGPLIIGGHIAADNYHAELTPYGLAAAPGVVAGLCAGGYIVRLLNPERFRRAILVMLILLGLSLVSR